MHPPTIVVLMSSDCLFLLLEYFMYLAFKEISKFKSSTKAIIYDSPVIENELIKMEEEMPLFIIYPQHGKTETLITILR